MSIARRKCVMGYITNSTHVLNGIYFVVMNHFKAGLNINILLLNSNQVWFFQAQKLLLRDGTLANFTIQSPSTLPTITLGLPANARVNTELQQMSVVTTHLFLNDIFSPKQVRKAFSSFKHV